MAVNLGSFFSGNGLSFLLVTPYIRRSVEDAVYDITSMITGYGHEVSAFGGFAEARISISASQTYIEDIYDRDLGYELRVVSPKFGIVYEGFMNAMGVVVGDFSLQRGPLKEIANRVLVLYAPILDATTNPPLTGSTQPTTIVQDTASIAKFGVWEKVLSGGTSLQSYIERARDSYLASRAYPEISEQRISTNSGAAYTAELSFRGYMDWLNAYYYNNDSATSTQLSTKLSAVLAADPNGFIKSSSVETNNLLVHSGENEYRMAYDIVKALNVAGNASYERTNIAMYGNRRFVYSSIPSNVKYFYKVTDYGMMMHDTLGNIVYPWEVVPGNWLRVDDILIGRINAKFKQEDPRYIFIESVRYEAPWSLEINGSRVSTTPQLLAQYGLGGMDR